MLPAATTLIRVASRPIESLDLYHVMPGTRALVVAFEAASAPSSPRTRSAQPAWSVEALGELAHAGRCATIGFVHGRSLGCLPTQLDALDRAHEAGCATALHIGAAPSVEECLALAPRLDALALEVAPCVAGAPGAEAAHALRDRLARLRQAGVWVEVVTPLPAEVTARDLLDTALSLKAIDGAIPWHVRAVRTLVAHRPRLAAALVMQAVAAGERAGLENVYAPEAPSGDREITFCSVCRDVVLIERFLGQPQSYLADGRRCPRCGTRAHGLFERSAAGATA